MEGVIKIEELRISCVVGIHAHERGQEQELFVDVEVKLNFAESVQTDSIADTVDYAAVCGVCQKLAQTRQYHLIETFAYEALHAVLDTFPLTWAKIRVRKPEALPAAKWASVEFEKEK
ncbi:MAG: Dihydroneopterin aldolase [Chlamydiales bacterium]|nr:Dihydroneopterin aldolase [Chlamydiales bacterium]